MLRPETASQRAVATFVLAVLGALGTLFAWALSSPVGSSPDDDYHLPSIWCAGGTDDTRCVAVEGAPTVRALPPLATGAGSCFAPDLTKSAECQPEIDTPEPTVTTDRGNWGGAYPPLFYRTLSVFVGDDVSRSVLTMRVVTSTIAVALVGALALLLPVPRRAYAWAPLLLTSVPLGLSLFASTNPSNWTILGIAALWPALYFAFEATGRRRWLLAAFSLIPAAMGAGSRADGSLFVLMVVVLVALMRWRDLPRAPSVALALVGCFAIGAALFLGAGHSGQVLGVASPAAEHGLDRWHLLLTNVASLPTLWLGGFGAGPMGRLGWLDTPFPPLVGALLIAVWFAVLLQGWRRLYPAKVVGLALVLAALVVQPLYLLVESNNLVGAFVQPRYVLPLVVLFTAISLLHPVSTTLRLTPAGFWAATAALSVAHSVALHLQLRRYLTGMDVSALNLNADREWWWDIPVSPMFVWLAGSLAFTVTVLVLLRTRLMDGDAPLPAPGDPPGATLPVGHPLD